LIFPFGTIFGWFKL